MVGTKKAIAISVRNYQLTKRYSNLESYLRDCLSKCVSIN
jgi:hypothetical protein